MPKGVEHGATGPHTFIGRIANYTMRGAWLRWLCSARSAMAVHARAPRVAVTTGPREGQAPWRTRKTTRERTGVETREAAILRRFCEKGYDTLGYSSSDGHCYPCYTSDIPAGAIDSYAPLGSQQAKKWLAASLSEGWNY